MSSTPRGSGDVLAEATSPRGQLLLRRTERGALELRVNGVFVMDDHEVSSELALADLALSAAPDPTRVLIGGLGLGSTLRRVLTDDRVRHVTVVELEPALVEWLRTGMVPGGPQLLTDPRVTVQVADVRAQLHQTPPGSVDVVLLDVDNGPGFLVHPSNGALYQAASIRRCAQALSADGVLAVWSMSRSPALHAELDAAFASVTAHECPVRLQGRAEAYWVLVARRPRLTSVLMSATDETDYRVEHDTMGEVRVPAAALYRAQTQRAVQNFPISGAGLEPGHVHALAAVKAAAAKVNGELGVLEADMAAAVEAAARAVVDGGHDDEFPVDVFQTGSGTSSNMNVNEVVATLATRALGRDVHPNDHVNASQSSNDVFPTSIHVAATAGVIEDLLPALSRLRDSLAAKAEEFSGVVKSGRTHLMDATPVTLGQEFGGYAAQVGAGIARVDSALPRVAALPLGGTAVGTGINTPTGFPERVIEVLAADTGLPLTEAADHFEAQGARDGLVELSGHLRTVAVSLTKICNDLRWMGSGPRTGLAEIALPDLQPGSSIMPGKVNPVLPEATLMVCAQVIGNDAAVTFAGASGSFELNVMLPVMARNVLESLRLLANASRVLADGCIDGITADADRCREYAESSPSVVTPLNRYLGYENAARIAKAAVAERKTIREVVLEHGYVQRGELTEAQLDDALDVLSMTHP